MIIRADRRILFENIKQLLQHRRLWGRPLEEHDTTMSSDDSSASDASRQSKALAPSRVLTYVDDLYEEFPGEMLRAACRAEIDAQDKIGSLVYGEVGFMALAWILKAAMAHCTHNKFVFYDLGSGSGRIVHYTALLYPSFTRCAGIEIIRALHDVAEAVKVKHHKMLDAFPQEYTGQEIDFIHGDILKVDWSDAGIVLVNSTCFTDELMCSLEARASVMLREGAVIITFTSSFQGECWEVVTQTRRQMSWGPADIFIHRRSSHPASAQEA